MCKKLSLVFILILAISANAAVNVTTVDFLKQAGVQINAAGPLLVRMDEKRNRIILANTLTSSISIIDGQMHSVMNIPLGERTPQHLKAAALTFNQKTGNIYLIGTNCFHIIYYETDSSVTINTDVQFESIAVDETYNNVFVTSRQSKYIGFFEAKSQELKMLEWLDKEEKLINLNSTPRPPIRKVISDSDLEQVIAVDGFTSTLYLFKAKDGKPVKSRPLPLTAGGRWHFAGYNELTHCLYLVIETDERKVIEAAKIDVVKEQDVVVKLPEFTEGVGINYNPILDEVYIPYDNFPSVHVVGFKDSNAVSEIKIPAFGNDASAIDIKNDILYIASWAFGEIDVIDLAARKLIKRITGLGILPHTFNIAFNPNNNLVYIPKGATAVNGSFGSALCLLDPTRERYEKLYTGWAPVDLIELPGRNSFLVFNSEDEFAEVLIDGRYNIHNLPYDYPIQAIYNPEGNIYLSYGPHQSYWPVVYIWGAKNGILTIDVNDLSFYDRRIPRQAHKMAFDKDGVLYFTQNNWGNEEQFLGTLKDEVRVFNIGQRIALGDTVLRETTQRILEYDPALHLLYLVRLGEQENDPSLLQIIDPDSSQKVIQKVLLGQTATDLVFDDNNIYVSNFESNSVSVINKNDFTVEETKVGAKPLKLCRCGDRIYVINHLSNSLQRVQENGKSYQLPHKGLPDNFFVWKNKVIITSHNSEELFIIQFDPEYESFTLLHREKYPYGATRFDTGNVSFYLGGQFGDALFFITQAKTDKQGRLWVTDFLSGKLFIIEQKN